MKISDPRRASVQALSLSAIALLLSAGPALAQPAWHTKVLAQKQVKALPSAPLYWEVQNFSSPATAKAAAQLTSLEVKVGGSAWLFTLAPKGTAIPGGAKFAEIGPVPAVHAPDHLLRVAIVGGPDGASMPTHARMGSDAFYVLTGQLTRKASWGTANSGAGTSLVGAPPHAPMQVSSTGKQDLNAFQLSVLPAPASTASSSK